MKARGLDPKEISEAAGDDAHPKSVDRLLSENKQQTIKPKDSGTSNQLVYNNDHSPSTPIAPSLNVPIVAHASKGGGRQQHYDERNTSITTGVSVFSRAVTPRLS